MPANRTRSAWGCWNRSMFDSAHTWLTQKTVSAVEKYWTGDFLFHFWLFREVLQIWMSSLCPCTVALQHKIAWQAGQKLQLSWFNQDPRIEKEVSADWDRVVGFHRKINNSVYYIFRTFKSLILRLGEYFSYMCGCSAGTASPWPTMASAWTSVDLVWTRTSPSSSTLPLKCRPSWWSTSYFES